MENRLYAVTAFGIYEYDLATEGEKLYAYPDWMTAESSSRAFPSNRKPDGAPSGFCIRTPFSALQDPFPPKALDKPVLPCYTENTESEKRKPWRPPWGMPCVFHLAVHQKTRGAKGGIPPFCAFLHFGRCLIRCRGYTHDGETGLYSLNSRYYDPEIGRFLNGDATVSTGQGSTGYKTEVRS